MDDCPKCGTLVSSGESTCPECGTRLEGATESFEPVSEEEVVNEPEAVASEAPVLEVRKGPEIGERFYLDRPSLTVGRDPRSDIFLNDVTVSRRHAVLTMVGGEVEVEDVGSLNGTYVNGLCVDKARLAHGDTLQIGKFQMVFFQAKGA